MNIERRTSNAEHRTSNECILPILKKDCAKRFPPSTFDILRFAFLLPKVLYEVSGISLQQPTHNP